MIEIAFRVQECMCARDICEQSFKKKLLTITKIIILLWVYCGVYATEKIRKVIPS